MIKYDRFWETLKKRHISQYYLIHKCGVDKRLLLRLRNNENVEIYSLARLCSILNCDLGDIVEYVPEPSPQTTAIRAAKEEAAATHSKKSSVK